MENKKPKVEFLTEDDLYGVFSKWWREKGFREPCPSKNSVMRDFDRSMKKTGHEVFYTDISCNNLPESLSSGTVVVIEGQRDKNAKEIRVYALVGMDVSSP